MNLSAIRLFVRELIPAKAFYEGTLGLTLMKDGSEHGFYAFQSNGIDIIVEVVHHEAPQDEQILVARFAGISFAVANIQTEYQRLKSEGVLFTGEPEEQFWGGWLATFEDPAGNQLQLVQHLG
jgi:predicted enzyme related to lactoylglutathione lyase